MTDIAMATAASCSYVAADVSQTLSGTEHSHPDSVDAETAAVVSHNLHYNLIF